MSCSLVDDSSRPQESPYDWQASSDDRSSSYAKNEQIPKRLLTYDFVLRSLRRRLWKAFCEDNVVAARTVYTATLVDFIGWLQDEQTQEELAKAKNCTGPRVERPSSKRSFKHYRKESKKYVAVTESPKTRAINTEYRSELLRLYKEQQVETEAMIGGSDIPILQTKLNPSEAFIADDYLSPFDDETYDHPPETHLPDPFLHALEQQALLETYKKKRSRRPRTALRRIFLGKPQSERRAISSFDSSHSQDFVVNTANTDSISDFELQNKENQNSSFDERDGESKTTPLHEAARIGAGELVRSFLEHGGDVNVKNGLSRTSLHMCSGGITKEESILRKAASKDPLGIGATIIPEEALDLMRDKESTAILKPTSQDGNQRKKASKKGLLRKMSVSFKRKATLSESDSQNNGSIDREPEEKSSRKPDPKRLRELEQDRMDAAMALLSWTHTTTGDGLSINAVDVHGRTSLHYAAELGRSDLCKAIASNFGVMLTIVDEMGTRTPCEIAAANGHDALAAELEARALLYLDPYGMEDEMLQTLLASNDASSTNGACNKRSNPNGRLVSPFRWFITCSLQEIAQERFKKLEEARDQLTNVIILEAPLDRTLKEEEARTNTASIVRDNALYGERSGIMEPYVSKNDSPHEKSCHSKQATMDPTFRQDAIIVQYLGEDHHLERYMGHHKWDLQEALKAFRKDHIGALSAAGIEISLDQPSEQREDAADSSALHTCQICFDDDVQQDNWMVLRNCKHSFCKGCLTSYAEVCAKNRTPLYSIKCPHQGCQAGFSVLDIRALLQTDHPESLTRIENASTDYFVTSHPNFRFCTHPGCKGVVHRLRQPKWAEANYDESFLNYTGAVCVAVPESGTNNAGTTLTYEGVKDANYSNCRSLQQPIKGHRFCFACGDSVHWPLTCERLEEWKQRVSEEVGMVYENDQGDLNELAQRLWIKANTRPCPECNIPIEKNDGCNHMVCHGCLHEFCWICRKDWKLHSTDTGGFFRCNIWQEDDPQRIEDKSDGDEEVIMTYDANSLLGNTLVEQGYGTSVHTSRKAWKKKQEMNRFIHHYTRWEAHKESAILEQKMADTACTRLAPVVEAAISFDGSPAFNFGGKGLSFVHNAFFELSECRSTLRHSYAFSFYRYASRIYSKPSQVAPIIGFVYGSKRKEKGRFERLQSELETLTEQMSDIVARSHLRATQTQITYMTAVAAEKRAELNNFLFQILRVEQEEIIKQRKKMTKKTKRAELFDSLQHIEENTLPYVTARDRSLELAATDARVQVIGDAVRQLEELLNAGNLREDSNTTSSGGGFDSEVLEQEMGFATEMWDCPRCTFMNAGGYRCEMCEMLRT